MVVIAVDYPVPFMKGTIIYRSIVLRIPLLLLQAFLAVLFYQVRNLFGHLICTDLCTRALTALYGP
jgi:hypothetical protein